MTHNPNLSYSPDELGQTLWLMSEKATEGFYPTFKSLVEETGYSFDPACDDNFKSELRRINLWVIAKAFGSDDFALNALHQVYLTAISENLEPSERGLERLEQEKQMIAERYQEYFHAWKDAGMDQFELAKAMLKHLVPDPGRSCDINLQYQLLANILTTMRDVLQYRSDFIEIERSYRGLA